MSSAALDKLAQHDVVKQTPVVEDMLARMQAKVDSKIAEKETMEEASQVLHEAFDAMEAMGISETMSAKEMADYTNAWLAWGRHGLFESPEHKDLRMRLQKYLKVDTGNPAQDKAMRYARQIWRTTMVGYMKEKISKKPESEQSKAHLTLMESQTVGENYTPAKAMNSSAEILGLSPEDRQKKIKEMNENPGVVSYKDLEKTLLERGHRITELRVVVGGAFLSYTPQEAAEFQFKNLSKGEGLEERFFMQMENGCKGNCVEVKTEFGYEDDGGDGDGDEKPDGKIYERGERPEEGEGDAKDDKEVKLGVPARMEQGKVVVKDDGPKPNPEFTVPGAELNEQEKNVVDTLVKRFKEEWPSTMDEPFKFEEGRIFYYPTKFDYTPSYDGKRMPVPWPPALDSDLPSVAKALNEAYGDYDVPEKIVSEFDRPAAPVVDDFVPLDVEGSAETSKKAPAPVESKKGEGLEKSTVVKRSAADTDLGQILDRLSLKLQEIPDKKIDGVAFRLDGDGKLRLQDSYWSALQTKVDLSELGLTGVVVDQALVDRLNKKAQESMVIPVPEPLPESTLGEGIEDGSAGASTEISSPTEVPSLPSSREKFPSDINQLVKDIFSDRGTVLSHIQEAFKKNGLDGDQDHPKAFYLKDGKLYVNSDNDEGAFDFSDDDTFVDLSKREVKDMNKLVDALNQHFEETYNATAPSHQPEAPAVPDVDDKKATEKAREDAYRGVLDEEEGASTT